MIQNDDGSDMKNISCDKVQISKTSTKNTTKLYNKRIPYNFPDRQRIYISIHIYIYRYKLYIKRRGVCEYVNKYF